MSELHAQGDGVRPVPRGAQRAVHPGEPRRLPGQGRSAGRRRGADRPRGLRGRGPDRRRTPVGERMDPGPAVGRRPRRCACACTRRRTTSSTPTSTPSCTRSSPRCWCPRSRTKTRSSRSRRRSRTTRDARECRAGRCASGRWSRPRPPCSAPIASPRASSRSRSWAAARRVRATSHAALGFRWSAEGLETLFLRSKVLVDVRAAGVPNPISGLVSSLDGTRRPRDVRPAVARPRLRGPDVHPPLAGRARERGVLAHGRGAPGGPCRARGARRGGGAGLGAVTYRGRMIDSRQHRDHPRDGTRRRERDGRLMAKVEIVHRPSRTCSRVRPTGHRVEGGVRRRVVSPDGFSLWMLRAELDDGSTIEWPATHGDEAVYVVDGAARGRRARSRRPRARPIVESDVVTRARAVGPTRIVHMGPRDPRASGRRPERSGPAPTATACTSSVRCGTYANVTDVGDSHYYADSTCPTCRITLLSVGRSFGLRVGAAQPLPGRAHPRRVGRRSTSGAGGSSPATPSPSPPAPVTGSAATTTASSSSTTGATPRSRLARPPPRWKAGPSTT